MMDWLYSISTPLATIINTCNSCYEFLSHWNSLINKFLDKSFHFRGNLQWPHWFLYVFVSEITWQWIHWGVEEAKCYWITWSHWVHSIPFLHHTSLSFSYSICVCNIALAVSTSKWVMIRCSFDVPSSSMYYLTIWSLLSLQAFGGNIKGYELRIHGYIQIAICSLEPAYHFVPFSMTFLLSMSLLHASDARPLSILSLKASIWLGELISNKP